MKHVKTGMCIYDTEILQGVPEPWGNVTFVELSNDCLNPAAQFQFLDNGAILSLKRPGCLFPIHKYGSGYYLDMFYLFVNPKGLDTEACRGRVDGTRNPAITQTSWGGLSVKYTRDLTRTPQTMCAVPKKDPRLVVDPGIDFYIGLTTDCHDAQNKRFNIGKFLSVPFLNHYNPKVLPTQPSYVAKRRCINYVGYTSGAGCSKRG